jgi:hypothetical protein
MMAGLREQDRRKERKKFTVMAAAGAGSAALLVLGAPILGAAGLVGTGYLAYDWFRFRAKRGMRF